MIEVPIVEYDWASNGRATGALIRLPYIDIETIELRVKEIVDSGEKPFGLLAPYSEEQVEFNVRCASRIRDRFPAMAIYTAVPRFKTYDRIKTLYRAGFSNIVVPQYLGGVQYDYYFQFIPSEELAKLKLHVAGGKFDTAIWNVPDWTWSKETL